MFSSERRVKKMRPLRRMKEEVWRDEEFLERNKPVKPQMQHMISVTENVLKGMMNKLREGKGGAVVNGTEIAQWMMLDYVEHVVEMPASQECSTLSVSHDFFPCSAPSANEQLQAQKKRSVRGKMSVMNAALERSLFRAVCWDMKDDEIGVLWLHEHNEPCTWYPHGIIGHWFYLELQHMEPRRATLYWTEKQGHLMSCLQKEVLPYGEEDVDFMLDVYAI